MHAYIFGRLFSLTPSPSPPSPAPASGFAQSLKSPPPQCSYYMNHTAAVFFLLDFFDVLPHLQPAATITWCKRRANVDRLLDSTESSPVFVLGRYKHAGNHFLEEIAFGVGTWKYTFFVCPFCLVIQIRMLVSGREKATCWRRSFFYGMMGRIGDVFTMIRLVLALLNV